MSRASLLFLGAIVVIPLVYTSSGIDPGFPLRAVLLSALTIALSWGIASTSVRVTWLTIVLFSLALIEFISIAVAKNVGEALYHSAITLLYASFVVIARGLLTQIRLELLARACAVLALIVAAVAILQFYNVGVDLIPGTDPPYGTMFNKNLLSSFLFLLLPAILILVADNQRWWRVFAYVSGGAVAFVLLLARSRSAWLGLIVFVVALAVILVRRRSDLRWWSARFGAAVLIVTAVVIYVFAFGDFSHHLDKRTVTEQTRSIVHPSTADSSLTDRVLLWRRSLLLARDHPFGVGKANWKVVIPAYGLLGYQTLFRDGSHQWTHAHNDWIEQLCELGVLGVLLYLALFVVVIRVAIRGMRSVAEPLDAALPILLVSMLCGFAVISCFDFPMARIEHMLIFLMWLAVLDRSGFSKEVAVVRIRPFYIGLLAIPALGLSIYHAWAEQHEYRLLQLRQQHEWAEVCNECDKIYQSKLLSLDELCTPILYYKGEAEFLMGRYDEALKDDLNALQAHPNHMFSMNDAGSCYMKLGHPDSAEVYYRRALAISPQFEESLLNLTVVYFNRGDMQNAMQTIRRCDTSEPGSRAQTVARAVRSRL